MPTENTSLNNVSPAVEFNTTDDMVIGKSNTYQSSFLIVAGSLLALLVWVAVAGKIGGQPLKSSVHEITKSAGALAEYQEDSASLALTTNIFGMSAVSDNDKYEYGCPFGKNPKGACCYVMDAACCSCSAGWFWRGCWGCRFEGTPAL